MGIFNRARNKDHGSADSGTKESYSSTDPIAALLSGRRFYVPGSLHETMTALLAQENFRQLLANADDGGVSRERPMVAAIWISELTDDHLEVTAGNRVELYWTYHVRLQPSESGTLGIVTISDLTSALPKWLGNIQKLGFDVDDLIRATGGRNA